MKLSIAICEDLPDERVYLVRMVESFFRERQEDCQLSVFSSGEELLSLFRAGRFQILFLDIYMPGLSGMDTARTVRKADRDCAIIFATTSHNHGLDSFEVQASDYLVKPFRQEDVYEALDWCISRYARSMHCLQVLSEWEPVDIPLQSLLYIEIQGHQARLHTRDQVISTRRSLDDLESTINSSDFIRCHRSFLVNMDYITGIQGRELCLEGGGRVPISPSNAAQVKRAFSDWLFARDWRK